MDEPLSNSIKKEQGELLIIDGNPEVGEPWMSGKGMCLCVFYCLCCINYLSTNMLEERVLEERDPGLNEEEDTRKEGSRDKHWRDVA